MELSEIIKSNLVNPKTPWRVNLTRFLWFFQKCIFQREGESLVFVTFNIITRHIFPEILIEIPQVVQKI